jgi:hypothetical protein
MYGRVNSQSRARPGVIRAAELLSRRRAVRVETRAELGLEQADEIHFHAGIGVGIVVGIAPAGVGSDDQLPLPRVEPGPLVRRKNVGARAAAVLPPAARQGQKPQQGAQPPQGERRATPAVGVLPCPSNRPSDG